MLPGVKNIQNYKKNVFKIKFDLIFIYKNSKNKMKENVNLNYQVFLLFLFCNNVNRSLWLANLTKLYTQYLSEALIRPETHQRSSVRLQLMHSNRQQISLMYM